MVPDGVFICIWVRVQDREGTAQTPGWRWTGQLAAVHTLLWAATFVSSTGLQAVFSNRWLREPTSEANFDVIEYDANYWVVMEISLTGCSERPRSTPSNTSFSKALIFRYTLQSLKWCLPLATGGGESQQGLQKRAIATGLGLSMKRTRLPSFPTALVTTVQTTARNVR